MCLLVWEFQRDGHVVRVAPTGPLVSMTFRVQLAAAVAGLGIMAAFEEDLAPSFAAGTLEPVREDWWQECSGPFLYCPSRSLMPATLCALVDSIREDNEVRGGLG